MKSVEFPLVESEKNFAPDSEPSSNRAFGVGAEPFDSYIEIGFDFPPVFVIKEMTDHEVVQLAEGSTSLAFLDSPDEDIYNDLLKSKE